MKGMLGVSLLSVLLVGCAGGDFSDLNAFMDEVRAKPKGSIEPLPQFTPYEAFAYSAVNMRSPFQPPVKFEVVQRQKGEKEVKPDEARVKQFLEGFNIETFTMVGTLGDQRGLFALVSGAGSVHRVMVGDYLGRNHGRIVAIDAGKIEVLEIVPDGEGGWLERPRQLPLRDNG